MKDSFNGGGNKAIRVMVEILSRVRVRFSPCFRSKSQK
jgi:hypothetical protein